MDDARRFSQFDPARALRDLSSPVALDPELEQPSLFNRNRPTLPHLVVVVLGGFLGTLARYSLTLHHPAPTASLDWTVVLINCSGALILGMLGTTLFDRRRDLVGLRLFLATGVLGGWTTYSAVIAGSLTLAHHHALGAAAWNLGVEMVAPVIAAGLGLLLGALAARSHR